MSTIDMIKDYLIRYATYVNQTRANVALDGLKAVQKRIYYVAYNIARDKFIKTATISGNVVAYYHPHGDASVSDAIVGMVRNKWLLGEGNWGTKCTLEEIKPAAPRYTEVKFNEELNWTMEYIKFAEYTKSDLDYDEPLLLPTPIPIGLIGDLVDYPQNQQGIGVGIKSSFPMYRLKDLVNMIKAIANKQSVEVVDPFISTYVDILASDSESLLTKGEGKVTIRPQFTYDKSSKELHIYALTKNLLNIIKPWQDKLTVNDLSTRTKTHVLISVKPRQRIDFDKVANTIIEKMTIVQNYACFVSVPDDTYGFKVYKLGIIPWLTAQFKYYLACRERFIQSKIDTLITKIADLELIKEIRPYLVDYLKEVETPDFNEFLDYLDDSFDKDAVKQILSKYNIKTLLQLDTDTTSYQEELNYWEDRKANMVQETIEELERVVGQ